MKQKSLKSLILKITGSASKIGYPRATPKNTLEKNNQKKLEQNNMLHFKKIV